MTDYEIDALYKTGLPISHAAGLWAVYAQGLDDAVAGMTACTCGSTVATVATVAPVTVTDAPVANDPVQPDPPAAA